MSVSIRETTPSEAQTASLLKASHALMEASFPPEENFFLDLDALADPSVTLFAAESDGQVLGVAALARKEGYAELKSMFVVPEARGLGIARRLLSRVEATAAAEGIPVLRLETGDRLAAAVQLYSRAGFHETGPFGDYPETGSSLFFEKAL